MIVKVEIQQTLTKVVEVDEDEFDGSCDTSSIKYKKIREFLLEQLKDEYNQVGIQMFINGGGSILDETKPDMKVSKKNGSYFQERLEDEKEDSIFPIPFDPSLCETEEEEMERFRKLNQ